MTGDFYECPKCGWRARLADVDIRTRCSCGRMAQLPAHGPRACPKCKSAAQPKPRDESVPAPGWTICDEARGKYIRDGGLTDKSGTWLAYDAEHGYAPDEARARADAPSAAPVRARRCSEILRDEARILRRVSVDDPDCHERCRVAAGYDSAAALLDLYEAEDDYASKHAPMPANPREGT